MTPFRYERAGDARSAVATVTATSGAAFLGGGTNLVDLMRLGVATPELLVDVAKLPHDRIELLADGGVRIGAAVKNSDLAADRTIRMRYPVLAQAVLAGAFGQLRNLATTGGNLMQRTRCVYFQDVALPCNKRTPGSGCPAREGYHRNLAIFGWSEHCVATHPSDMAVALAALDAIVRVHGPGGERTIPLVGFHRLPGDEPQRDTVLAHGELITAVDLPALAFSGRSRYAKARDRASFSFALVSVAAALDVADGIVREARLALGGVAHHRGARRVPRARCAGCRRPTTASRAPPTRSSRRRDRCARTGSRSRSRATSSCASSASWRTCGDERRHWHPGSRARPARRTGEGYGRREIRVRAPPATRRLRARDPEHDPEGANRIDRRLCRTRAPRRRRRPHPPERAARRARLRSLARRAPRRSRPVPRKLCRAGRRRDARDRTACHRCRADPLRERAARRRVALRSPQAVRARARQRGVRDRQSAGHFEGAFAAAPVRLDATYTTPREHNNPIEMHATIAEWTDEGVTIHDANQGPHTTRDDIAQMFGLAPEHVRVITPYVGGGFGSKAFTHPHVILAVMAAKVTGRPVKLMVTRHGMFANVGYRPQTIQRVRVGAEQDGRLTAIAHEVVEHTSTVEEYAEQTIEQTRHMYAAPNRRTTHRLVKLDLSTPSIMRAPGECPGMFALESALDELAIALRIDPVELRIRNEPERDPESGKPFSTRNLVAALREGARRFGWEGRDPTPGIRRKEGRLVGTGVAAATYPARRRAARALARVDRSERYQVLIDAVDIGTGTWTILAQIAADALGVPLERVELAIGDSALPRAPGAGGSMGASSWGTAVIEACRALRRRLDDDYGGTIPADGLEAYVKTEHASQDYAMHGFGAQFTEVHVDEATCEVRVAPMLGVFAVGRILNPKTARSQLIGGMTMGLGMALHEESVVDERFGHFANHDFAEYHIPVNADVREIEAIWIDEFDEYVNPMGSKGIGEIGITGAAAAIANAVHHATGVRVRELPITLDKLLR